MGKKFGDLFRKRRKEANKTLGETARHLEVSITYLSDVERKARPPLGPDRIRRAADFFGIDATELLASAAVNIGDFRMSTENLSERGRTAMAALQRGLPEFDDAFFDELIRLAERKREV